MKIEFHDGLKTPTRREASRVVIYDNYGNAIATMLQIDIGNIDVRIKGQPGFEEALQFLGIKQTVLVDTIHPDKPQPQLVF